MGDRSETVLSNRRLIGDWLAIDGRLFNCHFLKIKCYERINHFYASCHHDNTIDTIASLTTKQNAAVMVVMVVMDLLGLTSSHVTLSASDISGSSSL